MIAANEELIHWQFFVCFLNNECLRLLRRLEDRPGIYRGGNHFIDAPCVLCLNDIYNILVYLIDDASMLMLMRCRDGWLHKVYDEIIDPFRQQVAGRLPEHRGIPGSFSLIFPDTRRTSSTCPSSSRLSFSARLSRWFSS